MASSAAGAAIKIQGTSTSFTNEATTKLTANTVYQITDATKRIIDPSVAVVVEVDADGAGAGGYVTAAASSYDIDYLFGKITFSADQGSSATVRISGSYLPTVTVAECTEYSASCSRTMLDTTTFDAAGYRLRVAGLADLSGSLKTLKLLTYDNDTGAGTKKLKDFYDNGTPVLLEIRPTASSEYFRAWVVLEAAENAGGVDGLHEATVNFVLAAQQGSGQSEFAPYGWGS